MADKRTGTSPWRLDYRKLAQRRDTLAGAVLTQVHMIVPILGL